MPFGSSPQKAFGYGRQHDEAANPRQITGYDSQERLLEPERNDLKRERQKQLDREVREREQRRQQEKDNTGVDKERKRGEQLHERKAREYDRAREQREKATRMRKDHDQGYAEYLGHDPLSDLRLMKHAIGVSVRKKMPGTRW